MIWMGSDWLSCGAAENTKRVQILTLNRWGFVSAPLHIFNHEITLRCFLDPTSQIYIENGHIKAYSSWDVSNLRLVL